MDKLGSYDVVVIGAGHAGIEAALAAARMGLRTLCFTVNFSCVVANHSIFLFASDLVPGVRRLGTGILYHSLTIRTRGVQAAPASFTPPARHRGKAGIYRGQAGQNNSR